MSLQCSKHSWSETELKIMHTWRKSSEQSQSQDNMRIQNHQSHPKPPPPMPPTINPAIPCPALTRLRWTRCVLVRRALWPRLFMIVSLTKKRKKASPRGLCNHFSSKMTLRATAAIIKSTGSNTAKSTGSPLLADVGSTCDLSFREFLCFIGSSFQ